MADKYTKTTWTDRVVQYPVRYTLDRVAGAGTFEDGDQVDMVVTPGTITAEGTDVLQTYLNNAEEGIESANNPSRSSESVIYNEVNSLGSDIYDGELQCLLTGRSDANLLEDDVAGCESTSGWSNANCSLSTDSSNNLEGTKCLKITLTSTTTSSTYINILNKLDTSKYYMLSINVKNGNSASGIRMYLDTDDQSYGVDFETSENYTKQSIVIQPSDFDTATYANLSINVNGANTQYGFVDALALQEITAEDYNSLSDPTDASDLFDKYPYHRGLVGSGVGRVKSVGKNLFDGEQSLEKGYASGGSIQNTTRVDWISSEQNTVSYQLNTGFSGFTTQLLKVKSNTDYYLSWENTQNTTTMRVVGANIIGELESTAISESTTSFSFNTGDNNYIKISGFYNSSTSGIINIVSNIQLEQSSTATTYEPYKSSQTYNDRELYSVPNGTHCTKDLNTGVCVSRVKKYVLESGDITALTTSLTNLDYVRVLLPSNFPTVTTQFSTYDGMTLVEGFSGKDNVDSTDNEYTHSTTDAGTFDIALFVPKGTYASLGDARTSLAGTVIHYELDPTSYETHYDQPQVLQAFPNGTIYNENAITEQLTYTDSKITITDTTRIINSLDYVYKIEYETDGEIIKTPISISDCTVASDGLTFTITGASNGEKYEFAYYYFGVSVLPAIEYTTADSTKEQINNNSEQIVRVNEKINDVNSRTSDNRNNIANILDNTAKYGASSAGSDAYVISTQTNYTAYNTGMNVFFKADVSNAGASSVNVDGLGVKAIKIIGSGGKTDTKTGDIIANGFYQVIYDGTDFILVNANALLQSLVMAQGDLLYASGANTITRLAKGTAGQVLDMNAGETAPQWSTIHASGEFSDTTTTISSSSSYTKTIATGVSASFGIIHLNTTQSGAYGGDRYTATILFNTSDSNAVSLSTADSGSNETITGLAQAAGDTILSFNGFCASATQIFIEKVYMDGTDLKIIFKNNDVSSRTLFVYANWGVWK